MYGWEFTHVQGVVWVFLRMQVCVVRSKVDKDITIDVNVLLSVNAGKGVHCEGSGEGERVEDVSRH